jgi:hypothetical protein
MPRKLRTRANRLVVRARDEAALERTGARLARFGSLEPVEGYPAVAVLHLAAEHSLTGELWASLASSVAREAELDPILVDEQGNDRLPTGKIEVRFKEPPSPEQLEAFASEHGLALERRNKFVPAQAEFRVAGAKRPFLPDLLDELDKADTVRQSWLDTLSRYERAAS